MKNKAFKLKWILVSVSIIFVLVLILINLNKKTIIDTVRKDPINELSQEEIKRLSDEYFAETNIIDDEGNDEISGGHRESFYIDVNDLYEKLPFKIAVELDARLMIDIDTILDLIKSLDGIVESDVKVSYEENSDFFIKRFGILTYSDFKQVIEQFNVLEGEITEGKITVIKNSTGAISLKTSFMGKKSINFSVDIIVLDEENMTYYWSVYDEK